MIKRTYKMIFGLATLLVGGLAMTANAQVPSNSILKGDVPFPFTVKDKTLPAGEYTVRQTDSGSDSDFVFEITNDSGKEKSMIFMTEATSVNNAPANSKFVFVKIGDKYFLSKIFVAGNADGNELERSKAEKGLETGNVRKEEVELKVGHMKVLEKVAKSIKKAM